jgi:ABC-type sugar transport system substrate-binding protein
VTGELVDRRTALRTALRAAAATSLGLGLPGVLSACGKTEAPVIATDYLLEYADTALPPGLASPPLGDLVRLVTARARLLRVQPVLSPGEGVGTAAPPADLALLTAARNEVDPATGKHPPAIGVAVAGPFEPALIDPVAAAAAQRGVKLVSYLVPFAPRAAAITVPPAQLGALLATHAAGWAQQRHGGRGEVLLVVPDAGARSTNGAFVLTAPESEQALRRTLARVAPGLRIAGTLQAHAAVSVRQRLARALRAHPRVRLVLCWSDDTAVGAAAALRALHPGGRDGWYVGGQGTPALTSRAAIDELRRDDILRALVAARPRDLAQALVDLPHALLTGRAPRDIRIAPQTLTPGSAALAAHARDYSRDPGAVAARLNSGASSTSLNPIDPNA